MATLANVLSYSRAQAHTDSNGISDTNGIEWANDTIEKFTREMVKRGVDAAQVQEAYTSAVAGTGTYLYPSDLLMLKELSVNFVNTVQDNYVQAEQIEASNLPTGVPSLDWLRKNQDYGHPCFDDRGDWFEILPTPTASMNLTNAFKILYFLKPTEFTATSDAITYPISLDYRILGRGIMARYYYYIKDFTLGDAWEAKFMADIQQLVETVGRGEQSPLKAETIHISGYEF